jgi:hypothetical protein
LVRSVLIIEVRGYSVSTLALCSCGLVFISRLGGRLHEQGISCLSLVPSDRNRPGFYPSSEHVGFEMETVVLGLVFAQYFGFPYYYSVGARVHDEPWSLFYSYLIIQKVDRTLWAGDQPVAMPPLT